jgi:hypothetical protein
MREESKSSSTLTSLSDADLLAALSAGRTMVSIASEYGCSNSRVWQRVTSARRKLARDRCGWFGRLSMRSGNALHNHVSRTSGAEASRSLSSMSVDEGRQLLAALPWNVKGLGEVSIAEIAGVLGVDLQAAIRRVKSNPWMDPHHHQNA